MNKLSLFLRRVIYGRTWAAEGDRWFNDLAQLRAHIEELEEDAKFDLFLDIARPVKAAESPFPGASIPPVWSNELKVDWKERFKYTSQESVNIERELAGLEDVKLTPVVPAPPELFVKQLTKQQAMLRAQLTELKVFDGEEWKTTHYELSLVTLLMVSITSLMSIILMHLVLS